MSDMAEEKGVDLSIISSSIHGYRNGTNGELHCRVITHHKQVRSVQTDVEDIVISAIYPDRMLGQRTRKLEAKVFLVGSTVETNLIIDSTDTFFAVRQ